MEIAGKLSHAQTGLVVYGSLMGNIVYTFTEITFKIGKPFWIAILLGVCLEIPFALWILLLSSYKKDATVFDLLEDGMGKTLKKIILTVFVFINMATAVCMLDLFTGSIKVFFLPRTPWTIIVTVIALMCAVFAKSGLKHCARLVSVLCVLATANFFLGFFLSLFKDFKIDLIKPVFDATVPQFLHGVLLTVSSDMEGLLLLMVITDSVAQTNKHYLSVVKGIFLWSIVLSSATLIMEGIVGTGILSRVAEAGIAVSSNIQIGTFISGLEIFVLLTYQYVCFLKVTILIYSCWAASKKLFNFSDSRPVLAIITLAVIISASWLNSYNKAFYYSIFLGNYIIAPFVIITLILVSISIYVKRQRDKNAQNEN